MVHLFDFSNPLHVAMWALFLAAFYSFLLKSNLVVDRAAQVSPKVILRSDLRFDASFAYLTIRASKTIQFRERLFSLPLPRIPGSLLCPVAALVNHVRINQVHQDLPLFSVRSANSVSPITYAHFSSFLGRVIKAVGLDLLATPLIVLGTVVLLLLLMLKYHLSLLRRRATGVVTVISFISKCLIVKRERPLLAWRPLFHELLFSLVLPFFFPSLLLFHF